MVQGLAPAGRGESEGEIQAGQFFAGPLEVFGVDPGDGQHFGAGEGLAVVLKALQVIQVGPLVVGHLEMSDLLGAGLLLENQGCGCGVGDDLSAGHCADLPGAAHLINQGFGDVGHCL